MSVDVLVIGAGPTGLYAAYYAGFRGLRVALMDSLPEPGGQISALYPEKLIYDIAGFPAVRGRDLVANLVAQADRFDPTYLLGEGAVGLSYVDGRPVVTGAAGTEVRAGAVLITGGIGTFTPRPLPAGTEWEGRGLGYFVPRVADYAGLDVLVVGGGDSALDWVLTLEPVARSVALVHRRATFRAHAATVTQVRGSSARLLLDRQVTTLDGTDRVHSAQVRHVRTGEVETVPAQAVVAALGFVADLGPLREWGLSIVDRHIEVDTTMATTLPRVYAAGDITDYRGKVRLISVGFGEAALAVNNAAQVLDPAADLFPGHSTDAAPAGAA